MATPTEQEVLKGVEKKEEGLSTVCSPEQGDRARDEKRRQSKIDCVREELYVSRKFDGRGG